MSTYLVAGKKGTKQCTYDIYQMIVELLLGCILQFRAKFRLDYFHQPVELFIFYFLFNTIVNGKNLDGKKNSEISVIKHIFETISNNKYTYITENEVKKIDEFA